MMTGWIGGRTAVAGLIVAFVAGWQSTAAANDIAVAQFLGIDRNGDDVITVDEANAYRHRLFKTLDLNGDHKITPDEWIEAAKVRAGTVPEGGPELPEQFRDAEENRDGILTTVEFWALGPVRFMRLDAKSDLVISKDEYRHNGL